MHAAVHFIVIVLSNIILSIFLGKFYSIEEYLHVNFALLFLELFFFDEISIEKFLAQLHLIVLLDFFAKCSMSNDGMTFLLLY